MGNFSETVKKADIFAQEHEIMFENGKRKLQTHCGVVLGLFMVVILVGYSVMKAQTMVDYGDNVI